MADAKIWSPVQDFNNELAPKFKEETEKYFEELVKQAGTDVELNRETVKKLKAKDAEEKSAGKRLKHSKALRGFLIFLAVVFIIAGVLGALTAAQTDQGTDVWIIGLVLACVLLPLALADILFICLYINKVIKRRKNIHDILMKERQELEDQCYDQVLDLTCLFEWNTPGKLFERVTPVIKLDDYLTGAKFDMFKDNYGFYNTLDECASCIDTLSGSINGFPFTFLRHVHQDWGTKTYTGTLTVTWTETYTDSNGNVQTRRRSQTLVASVIKPIPTYADFTYLVYGNDFCPELSFSRDPSGLFHPKEKEVNKYVTKGEHDLNKIADRAIKAGNLEFTPMNNTKFDTIFRAWDRNNGLQFMEMFDVLAQQNLTELMIGENSPYGDNFKYEKNGSLTAITSNHIQKSHLNVDPIDFYHYDIDVIHNTFVSEMCTYFKEIYFNIAPLLCITPYQQYEPKKEAHAENYKGTANLSSYEHEYMLNSMPEAYLQPDESITPCILKAVAVTKAGNTDMVHVESHAFKGIDRVDYILTPCQDGNSYEVPVHWVEYIPVQAGGIVAIKRLDLTTNGYYAAKAGLREVFGDSLDKSVVYKKGMLAFFADGAYNEDNDRALDEIAHPHN